MAKEAKQAATEEVVENPVVVEETAVAAESSQPTAKAGKRSAKAAKETEEKQAKEERKAKTQEDEEAKEATPKQVAKPTRTHLERQGKKFRKVAEQIDKTKLYPLAEAVELAVKTSPVKFDATVELHVNLNVDPKQADQNIRDNLVLPAGTGKTIRVAAFADGTFEGADITGVDTVLKQLEKGVIGFDILIATPANMPKLGKYARVLGPRGLMPNPKSGTVTNDVSKAVKEAKAGRVEYRVDSMGIIHLGIGKVSFGKDKIEENAKAIIASIKGNKPASVKSTYIDSVFITTSMGPSIAIAANDL